MILRNFSATKADIKLLAEKLAEGMDLCVRARKLDEAMLQAVAVGDGETKCLTPALWVQDQYERDLAAWEASAKALVDRCGGGW